MATLIFKALVPLFFTRIVDAAYDQFYFTTSSSENKCADSNYSCPAPSVCTHDNVIKTWYCCEPGENSVCWAPSQDCNDELASTQISCGSGDDKFCCLSGRETCTLTKGLCLHSVSLSNDTDAIQAKHTYAGRQELRTPSKTPTHGS